MAPGLASNACRREGRGLPKSRPCSARSSSIHSVRSRRGAAGSRAHSAGRGQSGSSNRTGQRHCYQPLGAVAEDSALAPRQPRRGSRTRPLAPREPKPDVAKGCLPDPAVRPNLIGDPDDQPGKGRDDHLVSDQNGRGEKDSKDGGSHTQSRPGERDQRRRQTRQYREEMQLGDGVVVQG